MPTRRARAPARLPFAPVRPAVAVVIAVIVVAATAFDQDDGTGAARWRSHCWRGLGRRYQCRCHDNPEECLHFRLLMTPPVGGHDVYEVIPALAVRPLRRGLLRLVLRLCDWFHRTLPRQQI